MPFTFSHPAIILPFIALRQQWRSSTGLIIGSMTPDFEKFIRMSLHDPYSHTWRSIFYFNLPMGLLLCFVFHLIVRDALIDHLPSFLRQRFHRFKRLDWKTHFRKHYPIVLLSLLAGIISHLGWDAFTHKEGLGVRMFPFLEQKIFPEPFRRPLYSFLQQVLSLMGGIIMLLFIIRLPTETKPLRQRPILGFWVTSAVIVILVVTLWVFAGGRLNRYYIFVAAISAGLLSLIILPFLIKIRTYFLRRS